MKLTVVSNAGLSTVDIKSAQRAAKHAFSFFSAPRPSLRGCVMAVQIILFNLADYSPSIAMELKVSKEITCKWQSQRFEILKLQTALDKL